MNVIFMGRKPAASLALRHLIDKGMKVTCVVAPKTPELPSKSTYWRPLLRNSAEELGIPILSDEELYSALLGEVPQSSFSDRLRETDLVISFLYWKKIREPLISLPSIGCFNFHPGPLPHFRGRRGYNFAILDNEKEYGASLHWIDEAIDTGDLVEVRKFQISLTETAYSLEQRTMRVMLEMFEDFTSLLLSGAPIPRIPQGAGKGATKKELLEAMEILPDDDPETTARRVRAFWYPPHEGAYIEIGGRRYTLVDSETLSMLGRFLHGSRDKPY